MDMRKADYYRLVPHVPPDLIDGEVRQALDSIFEISQEAHPVTD